MVTDDEIRARILLALATAYIEGAPIAANITGAFDVLTLRTRPAVRAYLQAQLDREIAGNDTVKLNEIRAAL